MILKKLKLRNFRNIEHCEIVLDPGINVFLGNNGQGKTNCIESVVFSSTTRSFRVTNDNAMIKHDCPFASIECTIEEDGKKTVLSSVIHSKGKSLFVASKQVPKASEFIGRLNAILFSPNDLEMFNISPRERRKLMDMEIGKISLKYNAALLKYQKCLKERNQALKMECDIILLTSLESQMVDAQLQIIESRRVFVEFLNQRLTHKMKQLCDEDLELGVRLKSWIDFSDKSKLRELMQQKYDETRERDILLKVTGNGCHRDDIEFTMKGIPLNEMASQGQKRMVLLAIKLCLIDFVRMTKKTSPVLILDDVLSELDQNNRIRLFQVLDKEVQTLITTTDLDELKESLVKSPKIFRVDHGIIR
ncbi:MAG: DNA replication/repair protein RecF [Erysipelotrichaceae bacterium]|nr:DNA replication/repair protein RecF [Erysipelotrichaceae bacterium]